MARVSGHSLLRHSISLSLRQDQEAWKAQLGLSCRSNADKASSGEGEMRLPLGRGRGVESCDHGLPISAAEEAPGSRTRWVRPEARRTFLSGIKEP